VEDAGLSAQQTQAGGDPVTFSYDALGRRTGMTDGYGRSTYTYDAGGRLASAIDPASKRITYTYDGVGRRATMIDPDAGTTTYTYNSASLLSSLVNPLNERTTWQYDPVGRIVTMTHASRSRAVHTYNAAGWVTNLVNAKSSGVTITSHAYSYDAAGNPIGMTEANGDVLTWTHDALNQLSREQRSGDNAYDMTYAYDPVGNRATKVSSGALTTYTYDAGNELTLEDAAGTLTTYSYDENGNTLVWNAAGSRTTLTWSYEDELLTALTPAGARVTMTYDADHMRRKREESADTTPYLWDGAQVLMDLDASNGTVARYTLAPFGYGDLVSQRRSGATREYHFDTIGSTRALTAGDEAVTDGYLYDGWGMQKASTGSTVNLYRYVGKLGYLKEDAIEGQLLRRRYYKERPGRFVSREPLPLRGYSEYGYVQNRPTTFADPSGSVPCQVVCIPAWVAGGWIGYALCVRECERRRRERKKREDREALIQLMQRMFLMGAGECCPDTTLIGPILDVIEAPEKREAVERACITDIEPLCARAKDPLRAPDSAEWATACYDCCMAIADAAGIDFATEVCGIACPRKML
jgi:RHS repeat-associated protein